MLRMVFSLLLATTACGYTTNPLKNLAHEVLSEEERKQARTMIEDDLRLRSREVNARSLREWRAIGSRAEWETYRDERLQRLQQSLGVSPAIPGKPGQAVSGEIPGDGFIIRKLIYESRPGDGVAANLYLPAKPPVKMPGILIAHSHHVDKTHGELQDMGMTWARADCAVLVIDQVGYGERRSHPFHRDTDYAGSFKRSRQDYYHRYDTGLQLQLIGESLMGWMVQDLVRGVDLLLGLDRIDPERIILLGGVAGGGDPCGITAALDARITAAVPFNFGGPQPETRYPLPEDAETSFNYLQGSYWDATRGLYRSGSDGFLHWNIVGAIAPRRLVYAHEFSWDRERDPVWKRFERIWGEWYGEPDRLAFAHGHGLLRGPSSEASHCTVIGRTHRKMIHPLFKRWFGIEAEEYSKRVDRETLRCGAAAELPVRSFTELVRERGQRKIGKARDQLAALDPAGRLSWLREAWAARLGPVEPPEAKVLKHETGKESRRIIERLVLETEPGIQVPLLILRPENKARVPTVIGLAQLGKKGLLEFRGAEIRKHLDAGRAVVLPDLRGTGETKAGESRGRTSGDGNRSVNMLLFGETLLGQRLRDQRGVVGYLRARPEFDPDRIRLWGESLVEPNPAGTDFNIPHGVSGGPRQPEALGGLLALLGILFDARIEHATISGGLASYASALETPRVYLPHDLIVPAVLETGDLCALRDALGERVRVRDAVDALNRRVAGRR